LQIAYKGFAPTLKAVPGSINEKHCFSDYTKSTQPLVISPDLPIFQTSVSK